MGVFVGISCKEQMILIGLACQIESLVSDI